MGLHHGIAIENTITLERDCHMSCEVLDGQIEFIFGMTDNGLTLYLDWPTLDKLMSLVGAVARKVKAMPSGAKREFMISTDARARKEHRPNAAFDATYELLVSDVDDQTGRRPTP